MYHCVRVDSTGETMSGLRGLAGRNTLITGAASGIGRATALRLGSAVHHNPLNHLHPEIVSTEDPPCIDRYFHLQFR